MFRSVRLSVIRVLFCQLRCSLSARFNSDPFKSETNQQMVEIDLNCFQIEKSFQNRWRFSGCILYSLTVKTVLTLAQIQRYVYYREYIIASKTMSTHSRFWHFNVISRILSTVIREPVKMSTEICWLLPPKARTVLGSSDFQKVQVRHRHQMWGNWKNSGFTWDGISNEQGTDTIYKIQPTPVNSYPDNSDLRLICMHLRPDPHFASRWPKWYHPVISYLSLLVLFYSSPSDTNSADSTVEWISSKSFYRGSDTGYSRSNTSKTNFEKRKGF